MQQLALERGSLPWRSLVILLLGLNWIICAATGLAFLNMRSNLPSWFVPVFILAILLLLGIISFYIWQVLGKTPAIKPPGAYETGCIWLFLALSIVCTSSLHQFAPFCTDIIEAWSAIPSRHSILKYNLALTGSSLLIVLLLAVAYLFRYYRAAVMGLIILAAVMLIPNDDCGNVFNRPWLNWIGVSPLMFLPNSVVLLIGYCALHGIRPRVGIVLMGLINVCVFLLGLGHITHVVW